MNNDMEYLNSIREKIIGCAIEVHKNLGPGLLESMYEQVLCYELKVKNISYQRQLPVQVKYNEISLGDYRLDLLVNEEVIVELKAVERTDPVFDAQLLTYLKITGKKLGLLINFNVPVLRNGMKRIIL